MGRDLQDHLFQPCLAKTQPGHEMSHCGARILASPLCHPWESFQYNIPVKTWPKASGAAAQPFSSSNHLFGPCQQHPQETSLKIFLGRSPPPSCVERHKPMFDSLQSLLSLFSYLSRAIASPGKWSAPLWLLLFAGRV